MNANHLPSADSKKTGLPVEADDWLREHPSEERALLESAWSLAGTALREDTAFEPDDRRIQRIEAALAHHVVRADRPPRPLRLVPRIARRWNAVATVVLLLAALGGYALWIPASVVAPTGNVTRVTLPDGSHVELNSGSTLQYPRVFFRSNRSVRLTGEAFFDVAHSDRPFEVRTFNSTVTVLGTRFNVRSWAGGQSPSTRVVLEEGKVRLAPRADEREAVILVAGQMSRVIDSKPSQPAPAAISRELVWRSGGIYYVDEPVGVILDEIERRTGRPVLVSPESLRSVRASIVMDRVTSPEPVLEALTQMRGWQYRWTGHTYLITKSEQSK